MPWALNLFVGNIFSVLLTGFMVPWVANHMGWWMFPKGNVLRANGERDRVRHVSREVATSH